jgi:hypothetical protein
MSDLGQAEPFLTNTNAVSLPANFADWKIPMPWR